MFRVLLFGQTAWGRARTAGFPAVTRMAAGFVLVGGRSSRMGRDKALLPGRSRSMVEELAARVKKSAGSVALVGEPQRYSGLPIECIADLRPGLGPLGGIEAALASARAELNLVVACDMPDVETSWLVRLLEEAESSGTLCVASRDAGGALHPLCAVYHRDSLAKIQSALDAGRLRTQEVLWELEPVVLESDRTFWNVNTPEEWEAWQAREHANAGNQLKHAR